MAFVIPSPKSLLDMDSTTLAGLLANIGDALASTHRPRFVGFVPKRGAGTSNAMMMPPNFQRLIVRRPGHCVSRERGRL